MAFEQKNENANNQTQGRFVFGAGGGRTAFQNFLTGNRDGLCGAGCTYTEAEIDVTNHLRFNRYEMFVQDTWRAATVTLDYGVRYVALSAAHRRQRRPDDVRSGALRRREGADLRQLGRHAARRRHRRSAQRHHRRRAELAVRPRHLPDRQEQRPAARRASWDPSGDGKTIVRGGYGLYYDQPLVGIFEQNAFSHPPFNVRRASQNASLRTPAPASRRRRAAPNACSRRATPFETPRTQQWNIGVQRQVYRRGSIDVGYVGSRGDNLIRPVDINQPQPADVVATRQPSTSRGRIAATPASRCARPAPSNYYGLLTQFRHEGGRAGTYTVNYTLSRNRTDATNDRDAVDFPQNPLDLEAEYADARTDRRHIFSATYIYELPFFRPIRTRSAADARRLADLRDHDHQLGRAGAAAAIDTNGGRRGNRANRSATREPASRLSRSGSTRRRSAPADGTYGDSPRAPFRLPGRNQTDLALSKNFYSDDRRIQFRADFINAFNHTQFTTVNADCSGAPAAATTCASANSTFGQITGRAPREIQLSLKLYW